MDTTKIYFDTEAERDAYNRSAAEARGCDMIHTDAWYQCGQDGSGFYVEVPTAELPEQPQP